MLPNAQRDSIKICMCPFLTKGLWTFCFNNVSEVNPIFYSSHLKEPFSIMPNAKDIHNSMKRRIAKTNWIFSKTLKIKRLNITHIVCFDVFFNVKKTMPVHCLFLTTQHESITFLKNNSVDVVCLIENDESGCWIAVL